LQQLPTGGSVRLRERGLGGGVPARRREVDRSGRGGRDQTVPGDPVGLPSQLAGTGDAPADQCDDQHRDADQQRRGQQPDSPRRRDAGVRSCPGIGAGLPRQATASPASGPGCAHGGPARLQGGVSDADAAITCLVDRLVELRQHTTGDEKDLGTMATNDAERGRFRRPLGILVMGYKAALGFTEILVGVFLAVPSFDPQATFARLAAEELREDPNDHLVALVSRHLPVLLHHRGPIAIGLIVLGLAKLVAAGAMWEGKEWGGYLLAATVALLLPLDLRQAVVDPTISHVLLAAVNVAVLGVLILLLRGWVPGHRANADPSRP